MDETTEQKTEQEAQATQEVGAPEPNTWQYEDARLRGCLEIANMINDTFDSSWSPFLLDRLAAAWLWNPLELARAMREAARNIEVLTISEKPPAITN